MTPFCKVDSPTYFIRGMASFCEVVIFLSYFFGNEENFFFTYCH
ncbi:unnamed protein product, partial [Staurois parvus]